MLHLPLVIRLQIHRDEMKRLHDIGLLTLLVLMAISAAGGYFGNKVYDKKSTENSEVQVNIDLDKDEALNENQSKPLFLDPDFKFGDRMPRGLLDGAP